MLSNMSHQPLETCIEQFSLAFFSPSKFLSDVEVGRVWKTRKECAADCVHKPTVAPVDGGKEGAYSVLLLGENEEDVDFGDSFTYTGGGEKDSKVAEHRVKVMNWSTKPKIQ